MNKKAFTLIELILAITILSIIMLSIFVIYANIIESNKKLELSRILQENARNITETIAREVREKGIDFGYYNTYTQNINYGSGNTILAVKSNKRYCLQKTSNICDSSCLENGLNCYLGVLDGDRISDDRVEVKNLHFYISGNENNSITNIDNEAKVTMVFDLSIMPGKGIRTELAQETKMKIQTTISEKIYKNNN
ncbi:type II secretion system GspH family protein [Candidatus Gracilibacteria bacterium]|nr:type II secretion system GspH family protein [Candidatus Gracilibacteria bacterium]